jgi:flagellar hook-associated protein 3 FlgL
MRITNTMMINNSLANISINKNQLNTLDTQRSTEKKINRPSEDPVIAIRALRLRSSYNQITEYIQKSIPDATSNMEIIQGALEEAESVIQTIYGYTNQGSTDSYSSSERATLADSLQQLKETYYDQGNVDNAGRFVFTGYRTDSRLTFASEDEADNYAYTITQGVDASNFDTKFVYQNSVDLTDLEQYFSGATTTAIPDVDRQEVYRMRLAYSNTDATLPTLQDKNGNTYTINGITHDSNAIPASNEILYNPDTGELLFGEQQYLAVRNADGLNVTYSKSDFDKGDVKPEHYFYCVRTDKAQQALDPTNYQPVTLNSELAAEDYAQLDKQVEYMINFSQKIRVNSSASQCFNIYLGRDIDDLSNSVTTVQDIETAQAKLKSLQESPLYANDTAAQEKMSQLAEALSKQFDLASDSMQETFDAGNTWMQNYQQENLTQQADVGNRLQRVELNKTRLTEQQTNVKELKSENEDIELEDVLINYASAELVYNSSLSAASKVVRQSLLDFL